MKKKRLISIVTALFMVLTTMVPSVFAAEDEKVVAYVQVPEDWQNPHFWAWDAEGNNAFDAWPGAEAEADPNNKGWYYCWLPSWVTNMIVSANDSEVQTNDFSVEGKNMWITVTSPEKVDVEYEVQTQGEAPAYVEKIAIHAKAPESWTEVNLWAWLHPDGTNAFTTWPGKAMKQNENGWYTAEAPNWINSVIINAGDGNAQTEDLTVEPKEMWITIAEDGTAEVVYENPERSDTTITVKVKTPEDWENACLWAWSHPDGTNAFSAWPGEPLTADGDWKIIEVPSWINKVIVNDGSTEGMQTGDIDVEPGKDIWLVVADAEHYTLTYEEPAAEVDAEVSSTPEPASAELTESNPTQKNSTKWIVAGGIVVLFLAAGVVFWIHKKKSGKAE